ncbi:hypothetical protein LINPERPRIM_LOCUS3494 [Linum perenne]
MLRRSRGSASEEG